VSDVRKVRKVSPCGALRASRLTLLSNSLKFTRTQSTLPIKRAEREKRRERQAKTVRKVSAVKEVRLCTRRAQRPHSTLYNSLKFTRTQSTLPIKRAKREKRHERQAKTVIKVSAVKEVRK